MMAFILLQAALISRCRATSVLPEMISMGIAASEVEQRRAAESFIETLFADTERVDRRTFIEKTVEWLTQKSRAELLGLPRGPSSQTSAALAVEGALVEYMAEVRGQNFDREFVRAFLLDGAFKRRLAAEVGRGGARDSRESEDHYQRRVYDFIRHNAAEL